MASFLRDGYRKAKKRHLCDGWHWIEDFQPELKFEPCKGINKGDEYFYSVSYGDDGIGTFKSCKLCMQNAKNHNLLMHEEW